MIKLNFKEFSIFTDITRHDRRVGDARESFANQIYLNVSGIRAHALAMKIYQSEGETMYTPEEVKMIREVANKFCLPYFIDGLNEQLNNQSKTE